MIIQTISTASQFRDAFHAANRANNFSYEALGLMFDYFDDCGDNVELDVIGICCEFTEMNADEVRDDYRLDADTDVEQYLNDNTLLIGKTAEGFYVFAQF